MIMLCMNYDGITGLQVQVKFLDLIGIYMYTKESSINIVGTWLYAKQLA